MLKLVYFQDSISFQSLYCLNERSPRSMIGMSGLMIEDQVAPKRCGHTPGKEVVDREEAYRRIRAAVDARREYGLDIVILARTDARLISLG